VKEGVWVVGVVDCRAKSEYEMQTTAIDRLRVHNLLIGKQQHRIPTAILLTLVSACILLMSLSLSVPCLVSAEPASADAAGSATVWLAQPSGKGYQPGPAWQRQQQPCFKQQEGQQLCSSSSQTQHQQQQQPGEGLRQQQQQWCGGPQALCTCRQGRQRGVLRPLAGRRHCRGGTPGGLDPSA
jgi:hypothetical protein